MKNFFECIGCFFVCLYAFFILLFNKEERRQYDYENGYLEDVE